MKTNYGRTYAALNQFVSTGKINGCVATSTPTCFTTWTATHRFSECRNWERSNTPRTFTFSRRVRNLLLITHSLCIDG